MPSFELTKSIEARKLNKRTGLPLPEPPTTISFGSIIENLKEVGNMGRFTFLFNLYEAEYSVVELAIKTVGDNAPDPAASTKPARKLAAVAAAAPGPVAVPARGAAPEVKFRWEEIATSHGVLLRAKVPGGWLLDRGTGLMFFEDAKYKWDGTTS
jgi:hypothetical protein